MSPLTLRSLSGADLADDTALFDACVDLWLRAFAGPPWHATPDEVSDRRAAARRQLDRDGTTALIAHGDDGDVVGAAWGWGGNRSPDDELHRAIRRAVGAERAALIWQPDVTVIVELMVDPDRQGQGIGGRLLDSLVAGRSSWLLSHPAGAGLSLYLRRGWTEAGHIEHAGTPLLVLVRDTTSTEESS